ncbi:hypothetical protein CHS0354_007096 [Potamilus streckersoni]|uniref:Uncharacterized protein n=1 Tax=Potamilus streckersoni TaxID=2493646 RepID=A0AAE0TBH8_9BIVA|nr:hypothetical protein CHS0354_007096 [Potamilus streckersoni]
MFNQLRITNSSASETHSFEIDPLSDTLFTPPSDNSSSPTNGTTSALPCEESTITAGIANQAASAVTASAPLRDIHNMIK